MIQIREKTKQIDMTRAGPEDTSEIDVSGDAKNKACPASESQLRDFGRGETSNFRVVSAFRRGEYT
jgi:hypothetical protein